MNRENTYQHMKEMGLSRMANALDTCLKNGDAIDLTHQQLVALIVEEKYITRKNRKVQPMIAQAKFYPELPSLEDVLYHSSRGFDKKDIDETEQTMLFAVSSGTINFGPHGKPSHTYSRSKG